MNLLFLVSGSSGSGKSSLFRSLMNNELKVFTTLKPGEGDMNESEHIYLTKKEFDFLRMNDGFVGSICCEDYCYGIAKKELKNKLLKGNAFVIVDFKLKQIIEKQYKNCLSLFIYADKEDVQKRMLARGDCLETMKKKLTTYEEDILNMVYYDEVVINHQNEFEHTLQTLQDIITDSEGLSNYV